MLPYFSVKGPLYSQRSPKFIVKRREAFQLSCPKNP